MVENVLELTRPAKGKSPLAGTVTWLDACIERGNTEVFSETILLTPGLAGELLRRNPENRSVRATKLQQFATDIRNDKWVFNGEPFIVSSDGFLNDGQHRATAVVEANKPILALFVFGVERDSRYTVDQGAARSASDYLAMEGVPNATVQASIARAVIAFEDGKRQNLKANHIVTNSRIRQRVAQDHGIAASAHFAVGHRTGSKLFAAPSIIGFCHYIFSAIDSHDANAFLTQVCSGEDLSRRDPAYVVRDRLLAIGRVGIETKAHIIFRGWNAFRQGRPLSIVKVLDGGLPALI